MKASYIPIILDGFKHLAPAKRYVEGACGALGTMKKLCHQTFSDHVARW